MSAVRRPAWWLVAAVAAVAAGCVAGAVLAPSSWWGVAFAGTVVTGLVLSRGVVPAAYRPGWTRTVVLLSLGAVGAGGTYAWAVAPFGPSPVGYVFLAGSILLLTLVLREATHLQGSAALQGQWWRAYLNGGRRR